MCLTTKSEVGIVWSSNGGENGTGVSNAPITTGAFSRFQNASSKTLLLTVCPSPPVYCASCKTIRRPVFRTESIQVCASNGSIVRKSIISGSMPRFAAFSAASRAVSYTHLTLPTKA